MTADFKRKDALVYGDVMCRVLNQPMISHPPMKDRLK